MERRYIAIDLKSFYASVECVERGLDPLTARLVVADESRTDKTICLAVSPALKAQGIPGRARLYEVKRKARGDFVIAPPRMAFYISYSTRIYNIYLRYIAPEDIHVYSIDEVFIDATPYLKNYRLSARELATKIMREVFNETGITATAGIGTNLYLAKVAMDIVAKHTAPDENGARIGELTEKTYREKLWAHRPITDFWRVGRGYAERLARHGIYTMGDIALWSETDEDFLYREFGANAELLIDHAWGWEPCEMKDIKSYRPQTNSLSSGQVLREPYKYAEALTVVREMAEEMALRLLKHQLETDQIVLTVGYDLVNLKRGGGDVSGATSEVASGDVSGSGYTGETVVGGHTGKTAISGYAGETARDFYGRAVPKHAHGTYNFLEHTNSSSKIDEAVREIFARCVDEGLLIRRLNIEATHIKSVGDSTAEARQLSFFDEPSDDLEKETKVNQAILAIKRRYGKNAILKGINYEPGATGRERNAQIGGHRA
ncbi:DNA methylase [Candidatus Saccharibacteria bacterium]|nr:DNA methylase [Candidatus Saccharibacteria bacterium]